MTIADADGAARPALEADERPAGHARPDRDRDWVTDLAGAGARHEEALRELRELLVRACRHQVWHLRAQLPGVGAVVLEELVEGAADEALVAVLARLDTFEGRSRFTTWAYKFGILHAANEVRRRAWATREVCLPDDAAWTDTAAGPEHHAEAADLAAAVASALSDALTPYQRRIAVALLLDQVPIDVLAERLGTTRGALYKTLSVARTRIRHHLTATGHLSSAGPPAGAPTSGETP
ncbi:sigma-70 family RNA polymerase sigma factor [Intrasporangium flavum]|uniref:sigma-70 family RNA polymerase sigma factor n=1 Tax=Intrasporangium flavum TaxID=1428657 RepID=UPI001F61BCB1|nr:sigma-70 family RNA polymerase sigma factor [Intrasporangium flavum]